ncbi:MAG: FAD-dependent oxidoreductase [Phycisphaerae bacterium]|nr:FAD-dependent oxidoreductase [Phycisphaerae bacterium]
MNHGFTRRDWMRALGGSGLGAGLGILTTPQDVRADAMGNGPAAKIVDGKVIQPQRELAVLHRAQVLVVGGGPAGVSAAVAAARCGVKVALVERYGHFGGLWTGGLVLLVIGHLADGKTQVSQGIGEEMMKRLEKLDRGICDRGPGKNPTVDAEALKYVMVEMVTEAGIDVFLHCWGVDAIMDGNIVKGAVFESKSGRQAILADVVVDATGDGDVCGAAGAEHEQRVYHIGLPCRIGNLDRVDRSKAPKKPPQGLGHHTPIEGVNWVNMHGPDANGLDVKDLSRLELAHRKQIWKQVQKIRQTPGYEQVYLMETAPQLGVRITRVLKGVGSITHTDHKVGKTFPDVVAVGGVTSGDGARLGCNGPWQVPYGALLPRNVENLLAGGRCISFDRKMTDVVRLIPNCFTTGHAAGVAAAVSAKDRCRPRDVEIAKVQRVLREQGAYLG